MCTVAFKSAPDYEPELRWYALQTKARHENKIADRLQREGLPVFLPTFVERRRWSDRWKNVEFPLFPCYLFVQMVADWKNLSTVLQISGVFHVLGRGTQCEPVPEEQIDDLQRLVRASAGVARHPFLHSGDRVRIRGGVLDGLEGILEESSHDQKLVVSIYLLRQAVSVSLDGYEVEKIASSPLIYRKSA